MAEYRTIKMSFWNDPFIEDLGVNEKLLYLYLFTCPHTNNIGVLEISRKRIAFETGMTIESVDSGLKKLEESGKIITDGTEIWIVTFIRHQTSTSPKLIQSLMCMAKDVNSKEIRHTICLTYPHLFDGKNVPPEGPDTVSGEESCADTVSDPTDTLSIPYPHPDDTVSTPYPQGADTVCIGSGEEEREEERERRVAEEVRNGALPHCPHREIIALYHDALPELSRVKTWTGARTVNLQARWRERYAAGKYATLQDGLLYWEKFFRHIHDRCDWLMGRRTGRDGRPFKASLAWLVMPENFAKVIEGRYDVEAEA